MAKIPIQNKYPNRSGYLQLDTKRNLIETISDGQFISGNTPEGWINVKDFGAVGDGVHDDTEAIQNAIINNRNIYIPNGNYKITNINITNQTNIQISGNQSHLSISENLNIENSSNIKISNIIFDQFNKVINITNSSFIFIFNNMFNSNTSLVSPRMITIEDANDIHIYNNIFNDFQYGILLNDSDNETKQGNYRIFIHHNEFFNTTTEFSYPAAIYVVGGHDIIIDSNYFETPKASNQGYAFYQSDNSIKSAYNITITNNIFKDSNYASIASHKFCHVNIINNINYNTKFLWLSLDETDPETNLYAHDINISNNYSKGRIIITGQGNNITINNNIINSDSGESAFYIYGSDATHPLTNITITNNKISNAGRAGLEIVSISHGNISRNIIKDCNIDNNDTSVPLRCNGIAIDTSKFLNIFENEIYNTTIGHMKYGLWIHTGTAATENIYVDNNIVNTENGHFQDWYTSAPIHGTWKSGSFIKNKIWYSEDANHMLPFGWVCTSSGTPGTWKPVYLSTVSPAD